MKNLLLTIFATGAIAASAAPADWHGAQWIGADGSPAVYPAYMPVFRLQCDYESDGAVSTVFFGANDERLTTPYLNKDHVAASPGTSYLALQLDSTAKKIRLLRRNYTAGEDTPTLMAEADFSPGPGRHSIDISCALGYIDIDIDGARVLSKGVNPCGNGGDYMAYPVLGDVGVSSDADIRATFTVRNRRSPGATVGTTGEIEAAPGDTAFASVPVKGQPLLRSSIRASKPLRKATMRSTARGIYTVRINGRPTTAEYFAPGASQYNRTHYYDTTDITPLMRQGDNPVEVQLAEGWWCGPSTFTGDNWNFYGDRPSFLALITLEYTDGTTEQIPTRAADWQCATDGPLVCGSFFQGEILDGRAAADRMTWQPAAEIPLEGHIPAESPDCWPMPGDYSQWQLVENAGGAVTAVDTLTAMSVSEPRPGVYIYDMGQNFAGVPEVTLRGLPAGAVVNMRYAEVLYPATAKYAANGGEMMMENIRAAMAQDKYICRGDSIEIFSPSTTFHGYRYIEISGIGRPLPVADVRGVVLSSIPRFTARFECSDSSLNRLWENILWSTRSNFLSIPTDCPQRNERMGWSGDISVFCPSANYLADTDNFLRRHMRAMRDCQRPDGRFPDIAPSGFGFGGFLWGSAGIVLPYESWRHYGDTAIVDENYDAMKRYMDYVAEKCIDHATGIIVQSRQWGDLGDWLSPEGEKNDKSLIWEAYYIHCLDMMAEMAALTGHSDDAAAYRALRRERAQFFRNTYIDPATGKTRFSAFEPDKEGRPVDTQISYVLPIVFGIADVEKDSAFAVNFLETLRRTSAADDGRQCPPHSLMTGFIGTAQIMNALSRCGATADAYALLTSHNYPSWLYPVDQGATTIWERLNSYTIHDGFGTNNSMNSFNHYSFGAVAQWLMGHCGGIRRADDGCGFATFVLEPTVDPRPDGLTHARAEYDSPWGTIVSSWRKTGDKVEYRFEVPEGTTALLRLPGEKQKSLKSGKYTFTL